MARISVQIDVLNAQEVVENKKGKAIKWIASVFLSEAALKKKIEDKICQEIIKSLRENLDKSLKEEGVAANLTISVEHG